MLRSRFESSCLRFEAGVYLLETRVYGFKMVRLNLKAAG
jgi:hypothetical protein